MRKKQRTPTWDKAPTPEKRCQTQALAYPKQKEAKANRPQPGGVATPGPSLLCAEATADLNHEKPTTHMHERQRVPFLPIRARGTLAREEA